MASSLSTSFKALFSDTSGFSFTFHRLEAALGEPEKYVVDVLYQGHRLFTPTRNGPVPSKQLSDQESANLLVQPVLQGQGDNPAAAILDLYRKLTPPLNPYEFLLYVRTGLAGTMVNKLSLPYTLKLDVDPAWCHEQFNEPLTPVVTPPLLRRKTPGT